MSVYVWATALLMSPASELGRGVGPPAPTPDWVESRVDTRGRLNAIVIHQASEHLAPAVLVDEALLGTSEAAAFFDVKPSNFVRDVASCG